MTQSARTRDIGSQASRLSWQTGFQPVSACTQRCVSSQAGRLRALTGEDACLPLLAWPLDCIVPTEHWHTLR